MEWASFSVLIWFICMVYVPYVYIGLNWEFMVLFALCWISIQWKRWDTIRKIPLWDMLRDWHQITYVGNTHLLEDASTARLYTFYPHGTHCVSALLTQTRLDLLHIRVACASVLFWIPIINTSVGWGNGIPAKKELMKIALRDGESLIVYPGGLNEIPGADFLREDEYALKEGEPESKYTYMRREGVFKLAKETNTSIVPVWVEGEYDTFKVYFPFPRLSWIMYRVIGFPWPMFSSGYWGSPFPKPVKLTVHVGREIQVTSTSTVDSIQERHAAELTRLKLLY